MQSCGGSRAGEERDMTKQLSIVVPCYNEEDALPMAADRLGQLLVEMMASSLVSPTSLVYFVDDGSRDDTWGVICGLCSKDERFRGLKLSRNYGHQNALMAGLMSAEGDLLLSIDADLQDDILVVPEMVRLGTSDVDIVFGVRKDRTTDTWFKRLTATAYYRLLGAVGVRVIYNHADFRLMNRRAVAAMSEYHEVNLFLRGIVAELGFRTAIVQYNRLPRSAGETKYPLSKMMGLAFQGITSFSVVPLRMIFVLGIFISLVSFLGGAWALIVTVTNPAAVPGWASTVIPTYFLGGIQMLSIGVIGEYLGRNYLESKRRPRFIIEATAPKTESR